MQLIAKLYYNAVFGALGGLIGWMLFGAFGDKNPATERNIIGFLSEQDLNFLLMGMLIGGAIAYLVVSVEGIRDKSLARFARLSTYGVVLGAAGGAVGGLIGVTIKSFFDGLQETWEAPPEGLVAMLLMMLAFGIGWTFLGMAVGMSEGIAAKSLGKFSYGTIGGALGGFIGGSQYGYFLWLMRPGADAAADASTAAAGTYINGALGLIIMGACIGSLTALVRAVFLPASVKVLRGWQEGREYGLEKMANLLGRKEHADIPLFRDMKVEKEHATIRRLGKRFVLFNNGSPPENTRVNDKPVPHTIELQDGDRIQLGNVILRFQSRAAVNRQRAARRPPSAVPGAGSAALDQLLKK